MKNSRFVIGLLGLFQAGVISLFTALPAGADVLVLVHGFASNAATWDYSGVNQVLEGRGWALDPGQAGNTRVSVNLPASAPLGVQSAYLQAYLQQIRATRPDEKLILAGHSAGGVVARLALLGGNPYKVATLVTIASPNLGTPRAAQGLDVVYDKPFFCPGPVFGILKDLFGGNDYHFLRYSQGVMVDLLPTGGGRVLDWANYQPHPDIEYHSIVRVGGDLMVPAYSQDLNQVPALRGKVTVWPTTSGHPLTPLDGETLARILE